MGVPLPTFVLPDVAPDMPELLVLEGCRATGLSASTASRLFLMTLLKIWGFQNLTAGEMLEVIDFLPLRFISSFDVRIVRDKTTTHSFPVRLSSALNKCSRVKSDV